MATPLTKTLFSSVLKTYYPKPSDLVDMALNKSPLMQKLRKSPDFSGETKRVPWIVENPIGGSSTYANALSGNVAGAYKHILVEPISYYQQVGISNIAIDASRNDAGALLRAGKTELDRGLKAVGNSIGYHFYRSSNGEVGQGDGTAANLTSTTWIFSNRSQVFDLHAGDLLIFSDTRVAEARTATTLTIVSIDRNAGSVVLSATPNSLSASIAADDFVFRAGNEYFKTGAGAGSTKMAYGLEDYVPTSAPTSGDSFTGSALDRSTDSRMSGVRVDGSSKTIEAGAIELIGEVINNRGDADVFCINPLQGSKLVQSLSSKVFFDEVKSSEKNVGGRVMKVALGSVVADLHMDPDCPAGYAFSLTTDDWECISYGPAPKIQDNDGNQVRQSSSFDGVNALLAAYYNWVCYAPHQQGRLTLPTL